jgi:hypothetical protein
MSKQRTSKSGTKGSLKQLLEEQGFLEMSLKELCSGAKDNCQKCYRLAQEAPIEDFVCDSELRQARIRAGSHLLTLREAYGVECPPYSDICGSCARIEDYQTRISDYVEKIEKRHIRKMGDKLR